MNKTTLILLSIVVLIFSCKKESEKHDDVEVRIKYRIETNDSLRVMYSQYKTGDSLLITGNWEHTETLFLPYGETRTADCIINAFGFHPAHAHIYCYVNESLKAEYIYPNSNVASPIAEHTWYGTSVTLP